MDWHLARGGLFWETAMSIKAFIGAALAATVAFSAAANASEYGTKEEAIVLLDKALADIKAKGKDAVFEAVTAKKPEYINKDLYVFCLDDSGVMLAHGANVGLVKKDLSKLKDADGKFFVQEQIETSKKAGGGWVDYKWTNSATKMIEPKSSVVKNTGDGYYCGVGIYGSK